MRKKLFIVTFAFIIGSLGLVTVKNIVLAEQSGSSPESGATSRIKTIYDSLVSLSHGSNSAGSWGNWGAYWNRIRSAGEWVPSGDANEADVAFGKIFYKDSRTQQTGTASLAPDYIQQSLVKRDNYYDGDETGEESSWTHTAGNATTGVWKDTRTGLYWSAGQGLNTNQFTISSCDFYTTTPRGNYAGGDSDCGNVINACANLSLEANTGSGVNTDWYLPTHTEVLQAGIDGMYNQTNSSFTTNDYFWTASEDANANGHGGPSLAITANLELPSLSISSKGFAGGYYRCVRRD